MARQLHRELNNRHIQLIAIGGAIGTGLFLGSGQTISLTGPSLLFTYMIIGIILFAFMRALGELLLSNSKFNSFVDIANEYLGLWRIRNRLDLLDLLGRFEYVRFNSHGAIFRILVSSGPSLVNCVIYCTDFNFI